MQDVLGEVVFAGADEDLGAGDAIGALAVWLGGGGTGTNGWALVPAV